MHDYRQHLREATLDATKGKPVKERADALNMIEAIITGDMTPEQILDAVLNDTMPVVYKPLKRKVHNIGLDRNV